MIKFIDLFAGIGGFRLALESLGAKCVFSSEIDKFACQTYQANFGEMPSGDITKIDAIDIPPFDILCAGFPCQPFSIAGKRKGLDDHRGNLFDEIIRIAEYHQPKVLFLENVKGLLSQNKAITFDIIRSKLMENYHITYALVKASDFGLPQSRERLFIVCFLKQKQLIEFKWPTPIQLTKNVGSILENNVDSKYTISDKLWDWHKLHKDKESSKKNGFGYRLYSPEDQKTGTLTARYGKDGKEILIDQKDFVTFSDVREGDNVIHSWDIIETTDREKEICLAILRNRRSKDYGDKDGNPLRYNQIKKLIPDLTIIDLANLIDKKIIREFEYMLNNYYDFVNSRQSSGIDGVYRVYNPESKIFSTLTTTKNDLILVDKNPRKLTPRECARLMGFPDSFIIPVSDTQAYKQFGNSIAVPVVKAIAEQILKVL